MCIIILFTTATTIAARSATTPTTTTRLWCRCCRRSRIASCSGWIRCLIGALKQVSLCFFIAFLLQVVLLLYFFTAVYFFCILILTFRFDPSKLQYKCFMRFQTSIKTSLPGTQFSALFAPNRYRIRATSRLSTINYFLLPII